MRSTGCGARVRGDLISAGIKATLIWDNKLKPILNRDVWCRMDGDEYFVNLNKKTLPVVLFDGFPRTANQARMLKLRLAEHGRQVDAVFALEIQMKNPCSIVHGGMYR